MLADAKRVFLTRHSYWHLSLKDRKVRQIGKKWQLNLLHSVSHIKNSNLCKYSACRVPEHGEKLVQCSWWVTSCLGIDFQRVLRFRSVFFVYIHWALVALAVTFLRCVTLSPPTITVILQKKKKRLKWAESRVDGRNAGCREAAASCSSSAKPSSRDPAGQSLILLCHCCSQMWWVKCYLILTTLWKITHGKLRMHGHRCLQKRNLQLDLKYLALVECAANEVALPGSVSGVLGV